jgi:solute carrier family 25 (mitochondrial carnitine/acylcarnitine transporter), member 20/29
MEETATAAAIELTDTGYLDLVSGGIGGMAGVLAGAPLDTVRIRQQQPGGWQASSAWSVLSQTMRKEGPLSIFRGMSYPFSTAALSNAVCFYSYGAASRNLDAATTEQATLPLASVFWAGCFAGAAQMVLNNPMELLKIRLQLQTATRGMPGYLGPLSMLRHVIATDGLVFGLYRGSTITAIRDVPSFGIYFVVFEGAREFLDPGSRSNGKNHPAAIWAAGGAAGALSWLAVYPFDVVKSRIQATSALSSPYSSWLDCFWQGLRREGSRMFVQGLGATLGRAFLVNGAIFSAFELCHSQIKGYYER